jgi:hypothetical protein
MDALHYRRKNAMKFVSFAVLSICLMFVAATARSETFFTCHPIEVASWGERVHVRCSPGNGPISYFAVNTSNPGATQRFTDIVTAALINNASLSIQYDAADTSGPAYGCLLANCRPARGVFIRK